eukprot:scaffold196024_cov23-Cyclotella_meneghiniana.AAC.1
MLHCLDCALNTNACRASWGMRCGDWTVMGLVVGMEVMGMMTLSSSSSNLGSSMGSGNSVSALLGSPIGGGNAASALFCGGNCAVDGSTGGTAGGCTGLRRGDRRSGGAADVSMRPGVLLRVTRL